MSLPSDIIELPSLTIAEVADGCNVSQLTVRRRIADGTLPAFRVGNQIRIRSSDLHRLIRPIPAVQPAPGAAL